MDVQLRAFFEKHLTCNAGFAPAPGRQGGFWAGLRGAVSESVAAMAAALTTLPTVHEAQGELASGAARAYVLSLFHQLSLALAPVADDPENDQGPRGPQSCWRSLVQVIQILNVEVMALLRTQALEHTVGALLRQLLASSPMRQMVAAYGECVARHLRQEFRSLFLVAAAAANLHCSEVDSEEGQEGQGLRSGVTEEVWRLIGREVSQCEEADSLELLCHVYSVCFDTCLTGLQEGPLLITGPAEVAAAEADVNAVPCAVAYEATQGNLGDGCHQRMYTAADFLRGACMRLNDASDFCSLSVRFCEDFGHRTDGSSPGKQHETGMDETGRGCTRGKPGLEARERAEAGLNRLQTYLADTAQAAVAAVVQAVHAERERRRGKESDAAPLETLLRRAVRYLGDGNVAGGNCSSAERNGWESISVEHDDEVCEPLTRTGSNHRGPMTSAAQIEPRTREGFINRLPSVIGNDGDNDSCPVPSWEGSGRRVSISYWARKVCKARAGSCA